MSITLRPEFPNSPSNLPIGHNGRPATREELEFLLLNIRAIGRAYRSLMQKHVRDVNDNITRGGVVRSEFDRCAHEAEDAIVSQLRDIIGGQP